MARPELNKQLEDFGRVVAKMRELGVASWTMSPVGDIVLGAAPLTAAQTRASKDPKAQRRVYYTELLGRPVTDAEMENFP